MKTYNHWSIKDINFLRENVRKLGVRECAKQLNRSESSVRGAMRRNDIGITRAWTTKDIKYLIDNYSSKGAKHCSQYLNASINTVKHYAYKLRKKGQLK